MAGGQSAGPRQPGAVSAKAPAGSVLVVWTGAVYEVTPVRRGSAVARLPAPNSRGANAHQSGAAAFTWRGDYRATGWLAAYSQIQDQAQAPNGSMVAGAGNEPVDRSR